MITLPQLFFSFTQLVIAYFKVMKMTSKKCIITKASHESGIEASFNSVEKTGPVQDIKNEECKWKEKSRYFVNRYGNSTSFAASVVLSRSF